MLRNDRNLSRVAVVILTQLHHAGFAGEAEWVSLRAELPLVRGGSQEPRSEKRFEVVIGSASAGQWESGQTQK